jgi:hypothetical protein
MAAGKMITANTGAVKYCPNLAKAEMIDFLYHGKCGEAFAEEMSLAIPQKIVQPILLAAMIKHERLFNGGFSAMFAE